MHVLYMLLLLLLYIVIQHKENKEKLLTVISCPTQCMGSFMIRDFIRIMKNMDLFDNKNIMNVEDISEFYFFLDLKLYSNTINFASITSFIHLSQQVVSFHIFRAFYYKSQPQDKDQVKKKNTIFMVWTKEILI